MLPWSIRTAPTPTNRRIPMPRRSLSVLAALTLVLVLGACAGGGKDDSAAEVKVHVAEQMIDVGLSGEQADCFADLVVEKVGANEVQDVDFSADAPSSKQQEDLAAAALQALSDCKIDPDALKG